MVDVVSGHTGTVDGLALLARLVVVASAGRLPSFYRASMSASSLLFGICMARSRNSGFLALLCWCRLVVPIQEVVAGAERYDRSSCRTTQAWRSEFGGAKRRYQPMSVGGKVISWSRVQMSDESACRIGRRITSSPTGKVPSTTTTWKKYASVSH